MLRGIGPAPDPAQALPGDRFNENRIGLSVAGMADLEDAAALLDANGVPHGDILRMEPFGIVALALRNPDYIQVELTAPLGQRCFGNINLKEAIEWQPIYSSTAAGQADGSGARWRRVCAPPATTCTRPP